MLTVFYLSNGFSTCGVELILDLCVLCRPSREGDDVTQCVGWHGVPMCREIFVCSHKIFPGINDLTICSKLQ